MKRIAIALTVAVALLAVPVAANETPPIFLMSCS